MNLLLELTLTRALDAWVDRLLAHPPHGTVEGWLFEGTAA